MYTYVYLVLKESTTYILYKSPHICEDLVYTCLRTTNCIYYFPRSQEEGTLVLCCHKKLKTEEENDNISLSI